MLTKLLDAGAKVNSLRVLSENGYKYSALHRAVYGNKIQCVRILLKFGADEILHGKDGKKTQLLKYCQIHHDFVEDLVYCISH